MENKRQLRQQKRQHKKLLRLQRHQHNRNKLQRPPKDHAKLNRIGFTLALLAPLTGIVVFALGVLAGGFAGFFGTLALALILAAVVNIISVVFCIRGLTGSKDIEGSRRGLGIAGLVISGLPAAVLTVVLVAALINYLTFSI